MRDLVAYVESRRLFGRHGFAALDWTGRELCAAAGAPAGRDVLEIGAGDGMISLWLVHAGARRVTSLEPEAAGATPGVLRAAASHRDALEIPETRWRVVGATLQEHDGGGYDLILCKSAINHLDEPACERLLEAPGARERYRGLFAKIRGLLRPSGCFVFSDCARENYWARLGRPSPWAPEIEWEKHQEPTTWLQVAGEAGLEPVGWRWWHPFYRLRGLGPLLRRRMAARCLASYFVATVRRPPAGPS